MTKGKRQDGTGFRYKGKQSTAEQKKKERKEEEEEEEEEEAEQSRARQGRCIALTDVIH